MKNRRINRKINHGRWNRAAVAEALITISGLLLLLTVSLQAQAQSLTRIYRGDDGGVLYLRKVDNLIYGFGEHPGKKYAYVLKGEQQGDRILAKFWDVAKGTRSEFGSIELQVSQAGARLVRKSNPANIGIATWQEIADGSFPWPAAQVAGFQKTKATDLDGAFVGDDASRHYIRELNGDVVWVAEAASQPDVRPAWVSVFIGKRSPSNGIAGTWADVPKGQASAKGTVGAALIGQTRTLALQQTGISRTHKLEPDYAVDWNLFASTIRNALDGKAVGYAFAIGRNGALLRSAAGGSRRLAQDGGKADFTVHTKSQAASTAKTITAVALVKALHERNLTVDAKLAPFLPECWEKGPGVSGLTFRELLNHTSKLTQPGCDDPYQCLEKTIATGRTGKVGYNNTAYALMRFLVPLVANEAQAKGQFKLFKCDNPHDELNKDLSEMFARYLFDKVLKPAGANASFYPNGDFAFMYNHQNRGLKGSAPRIDFSRRAGAGYLSISATDYVLFIGALNRGEILPKALVQSMYAGNLGFDGPAAGAAGSYYTKNGGCPDKQDNGIGCGAQVMVYPSGIQAYVMVNSGSNSYSGNLKSILQNAFDTALKK
jgi:CubicO group peptidase (beta-lactamase class C family)